jgi:hypothetical protein
MHAAKWSGAFSASGGTMVAQSRSFSGCWQRGWNGQPGGGEDGLGTSPCSTTRIGRASGSATGTADSSARVYGCLGVVDDGAGVTELDDAAEIHDRDAVADVLDHAEVVGNEEVGQAEAVLQVLEQVEHLRLDRHVERGDRLVADDEVGLYGKRARDADSLALAAAELVRVARGVIRRQADGLEQLGDACIVAARPRVSRCTRALHAACRRRSCGG